MKRRVRVGGLNAWNELAGYVPEREQIVNIFLLPASSRMDSIERNLKAIIKVSSVSRVSPAIDDNIRAYINMAVTSKYYINLKAS